MLLVDADEGDEALRMQSSHDTTVVVLGMVAKELSTYFAADMLAVAKAHETGFGAAL